MKKIMVIKTKTEEKFNPSMMEICSVPLIEHIITELKTREYNIIVTGDEEVKEYLKNRDDVEFLKDACHIQDATLIDITTPASVFGDETKCVDYMSFVHISKVFQMAVINRLFNNNVLITSPENTYISPLAKIGEKTVIYPNVYIEGNTKIGENCRIYPDTTLKDCVIGNNCTIRSSVITESEIGNEANIGPFAYIRPGCCLGDCVKVGDFVELKNSKIGNGTKVPHLTYVGDSKVGEKVNFGCGTVTVNYDGKNKHSCQIGDNVFIGCNTNLVAPVKVGDGAFVAAGSTIVNEVPENGFSIARSRQTNKENWVKPKDR